MGNNPAALEAITRNNDHGVYLTTLFRVDPLRIPLLCDHVLAGREGLIRSGYKLVQNSNANIPFNGVTNTLYGDAHDIADSAKGGNDVLSAGTETAPSSVVNDMWGDGTIERLRSGRPGPLRVRGQ